MASNPANPVDFSVSGIDGGERRVSLPPPLPTIVDDFDWIARDYDSFRLMMMEELAYRHPDRRRWTPADVEAVIVELVASALDRLSHATDAIHAERYLETARRPQSVRRLLQMIGYDPFSDPYPGEPRLAGNETEKQRQEKVEALEQFWRAHPAAMNYHREQGPARIREQMRMVTLADHVRIFEEHPLVERARARVIESDPWTTILVTVLLPDSAGLDDAIDLASPANAGLATAVERYSSKYRLPAIVSGTTTFRTVLEGLAARYRMLGTELVIEQARTVPIRFAVRVEAGKEYFRSELLAAIREALSVGEHGLFRPGRLDFGDPVYASDIIEAVAAVEGVVSTEVTELRLDGEFPDRSRLGFVTLAADEIAVSNGAAGGFSVEIVGGALG